MKDADMRLRRNLAHKHYLDGWMWGAGHMTKGRRLLASEDEKIFDRGHKDGTAARVAASNAFTEHLRATAYGYIEGEPVAP